MINTKMHHCTCPRCKLDTMSLEQYSVEARQIEFGIIPLPKIYSRFRCYSCETEIQLSNELKQYDIGSAIGEQIKWLENLK